MKTYFAYGSNLNEVRFKSRIKSAQFKSRATLTGYRLVFEKPSLDGSGKATIIPDPNSSVEGAIFTYSDEEHDALKQCEGGYSETPVTLATDAGPFQAETFVANKRVKTLKPFDWYVEHIVAGGQKLGLPADYLAALAEAPTTKDMDAKRVADERVFLK